MWRRLAQQQSRTQGTRLREAEARKLVSFLSLEGTSLLMGAGARGTQASTRPSREEQTERQQGLRRGNHCGGGRTTGHAGGMHRRRRLFKRRSTRLATLSSSRRPTTSY